MSTLRTVISTTFAVACLAFAGAATANAATVRERPVSFTVANVNRTLLPCATDGRTYTIRGHLNGTADELRSGKVTLLLHGLGLGEFFWRISDPAGYDFAANLAQRGHATVTIDRLGYGRSGKPQGMGSCIGGQADIAHQIIGQLKSGSYHGALTPHFAHIGLIGHSAGGQITEVESYSFHDAQAIGILAYADQGLSAFQLSLGAAAAQTCMTGGLPEDVISGPGGYASLAGNLALGLEAFFHSAPIALQAQTAPLLSRDPCGDLASYSAAPAVDLQHLGSITQPVLLVQGGHDALFPPPSVRDQASLFTAARSVTYADLPDAGHALTYETGHVRLADIVARYLSRNGL